jgi:uncharacterized membrane protein YGL010W
MSVPPATESEFIDHRRDVDRLLGNYSEDHRNPTNQRIHWICVPLIVWTVVALLWVVPVPASIGKPGLWAALVMVGAFSYYLKLSRVLAFAALAVFVALAFVTQALYVRLGASALLWTAVAVFVLAWIAQFIGHEIEGKRPSFLTDLQYLLVGPIWLMSKAMRRFGVAY